MLISLAHGRRFALQQGCHGGSAGLGLGVGGEGRFRHGAGDRGVADHVDAGQEPDLEADRVDRAPAGPVGGAGIPRDAGRRAAAG